MVTRKCLKCGEVNYSADTFEEFWNCCKCGSQIPKSQEKPIPKEGERDDQVRRVRSKNTLSATI